MNRWTTIDLITLTNTVNSVGDPIQSKAYATKFAKLKSVRQSEFYQAAANGLRPEVMFEISSIDYSCDKSLRYNSAEYEVVREYDKGVMTELICQGVTNGIA